MKRLLIMTMLLTMPLTAKAQWNGLPLGTNHYDWNVLRTNSPASVFAQLWYACVERYQCFPIGLLYGGSVPQEYDIVNTLNVTTGFSIVVTNIVQGGVTNTYTNRIPVFKTIAITNDLYNKTNLFSSVTVIGTNQNGVCFTNEAYLSLVGEGSISANSSDKNYFETPYYPLMLSIVWEGSPGSAGSVVYYVNTNLCSNGTYDTWFARTNSSGVHPTTLPTYDAAILFANELGDEYGLTVSTDSWGVVHGQANNADIIHFNRHLSERSAFMAHTSYTNPAWSFRKFDDLVGYSVKTYPTAILNAWFNVPWKTTSMFPVLTYVTTNAVPVGAKVTISGTVCITNHTTFYTNLSQYITTGYTNAVTLTGTNTLLTNYWFAVTNLDCPTSGVTWGDSVVLQYTNGWRFFDTIWDDGDAGVLNHFEPHELNNGDFDQRYKILNAMRWANSVSSWSGTRNAWSGIDPNWETAKAMCAANQTATNDPSTSVPISHTYAYLAVDGYHVFAESVMSYAVGTIYTNGRATNYAHDADYYLDFEPAYNGVAFLRDWDAQGSSYSTNPPYCQLSTDMTATNLYPYACTSAVTVGTDVFPPVWCNVPTNIGVGEGKGYQVNDLNCLIRFDVPGGFAYK